ncbi:acetyl-coenzyme A synthetase N-terminal domain-containing protein [Streptomyces sp. SID12501]|nr:acetyl-coenzyme A synthetase N-terminal domain-containing protein [Streptomyces sp. SID12501]
MWKPPADAWEKSALGRFAGWLATHGRVEAHDYESLRAWSVREPSLFWQSIAEYFDVRVSQRWETVRTDDPMPDCRWFTGSTLNYAEHMLRTTGPATAIHARSHTRGPFEVSFDALRDQVARTRAGLPQRGPGSEADLPSLIIS